MSGSPEKRSQPTSGSLARLSTVTASLPIPLTGEPSWQDPMVAGLTTDWRAGRPGAEASVHPDARADRQIKVS